MGEKEPTSDFAIRNPKKSARTTMDIAEIANAVRNASPETYVPKLSTTFALNSPLIKAATSLRGITEPLANCIPKSPIMLNDLSLTKLELDIPELNKILVEPLSIPHLELGSALKSLQAPAYEKIREIGKLYASCFNFPAPSLERLSKSAERMQTQMKFLSCIKKTNWPLQFTADEALIESLAEIESRDGLEEDEYVGLVDEIIFENLDETRLEMMRCSWKSCYGLNREIFGTLTKALHLHQHAEYMACVSILMCLFESFIDDTYKTIKSIAEYDQELIDLYRSERGQVKDVGKEPRYVKERLLALVGTQDKGVYFWKSAFDYIADITLTSKQDFQDMSERNPLRNKICHGAQTNYGTKLHSLKAIVVTDLVIQLRELSLEGIAELTAV